MQRFREKERDTERNRESVCVHVLARERECEREDDYDI